MKFTLKDYQSEAVDLLLERLQRAQSDYRLYGTRSSVSLCATTPGDHALDELDDLIGTVIRPALD